VDTIPSLEPVSPTSVEEQEHVAEQMGMEIRTTEKNPTKTQQLGLGAL
jgi:hypothetical protein